MDEKIWETKFSCPCILKLTTVLPLVTQAHVPDIFIKTKLNAEDTFESET